MTAAEQLGLRLSREVAFVVSGDPISQPKPSSVGTRRFYPQRYLRYRQLVVDIAQAAAAELEGRGEPWHAHASSYRVHLLFVRETRRPSDIDRLQATVFDALTRAGMWADDKLCSSVRADREIDRECPRLEVRLQVLA